MFVAFFLICIALIELSFCKQTNRLSSYILIGVMAFIMGGSIVNADYEGYKILYENSIHFNVDDFFNVEKSLQYWYPKDSGYALINSAFVSAGFLYVEFKTIIAFVFYVIGYYIIYNLTTNANRILVVYLFFPFFLDVIQIRNFYTMILLLLGTYLYAKSQSVKKYLIVASITATLHATSLVMFFYIFVDRLIEKEYCKKIINLCVVIGFCFPLYVNAIENLVGGGYDVFLADSGFAISAYGAYASDATEGRYGKFILYVYVCTMMIIMRKVSIQLKKESLPQFMYAFVRTVYVMHLCIVILLPALALTTQFGRLPRNLLLEDYIVLTIFYKYCWCGKNAANYMIGAMVAIFVFAVYALYWNYGNEVVNIINNNYYIEYML